MADDSDSIEGSYSNRKPWTTLRTISVLAFIPAFPLCISHGVLAQHPVPAVGLVPLTASAVSALFLISRSRHSGEEGISVKLSHPVITFAVDSVLAAALMVVLVFTWVDNSGSASLSMLAAYATIPLLSNFLIHTFLALGSLYDGLAIHGLVQWIAWRAVPPECPHCHHNLRPDLPEIPWLERLHQRRRSHNYARLFVDDAQRYHDDDGDEEEGHASHSEPPEPVDVRKKDKKGKGTPVSSGSIST